MGGQDTPQYGDDSGQLMFAGMLPPTTSKAQIKTEHDSDDDDNSLESYEHSGWEAHSDDRAFAINDMLIVC